MQYSDQLLEKMNSFDPKERRNTLEQMLYKAERGRETSWVNMHLHTFFSYNGEGYSPSRLAWEAYQTGLYAIAICDFDVLTGLKELFDATDLLNMRSMAGFETRTFFREYSDVEINSPGEPGIFYFMGTGFVQDPPVNSVAEKGFENLLDYSHNRNGALIERINEKLDGVQISYKDDVMPLTPAGNATERHIIQAYYEKALSEFQTPEKAAAFWARVLDKDENELQNLIHSVNDFMNLLRSGLVKRGGLAYQQPGPEAFPELDEVIEMIQDQRAIPTSTWLDGTREGEQNPHDQLRLLMDKGIEAVNIIPDRNWNISDPEEKAQKVAELGRYVGTARTLGLPINVGTELNKPGQRFVDDFTCQPLSSFLPDFLEGAQIMVGHTRLLKYADLSYADAKAKELYPDRFERNKFFAAVGALPSPSQKTREKLAEMDAEKAYSYFQDSVQKGEWK